MTIRDLLDVYVMKLLWPILAVFVTTLVGEVLWRAAVYFEMRKARKDRRAIWTQQHKMWLALINHTHDDEGKMILSASDLREQFEPPLGENSVIRDIKAVVT